MAKPVRKREADTVAIQQLWAAVEFIRKQRQVANIERICRFTQRSFGLKDSQVDLHLVQAVHDGMISAYKAVGFKGSRTGMEQEGYKIPDIEDFERGSHDWYCFDCHQAGEVVECDGCWRVYHPTCTEEDWTGPKFICSVCKNVQPNPGNMKKREVSNLMKYVCNRLKDKTKQLHNLKARDEVGEMHVSRLLYTYMDLNTMEAKAQANKYPNMEQFFADARTLLHNTFILFGDAGEVAQLARIMIRDCKYDLDEIRQCKDCYYYSNAKPKDWFCQPCRPAHRLVFAKQKGFSFWPAKVIKSTREGNDVRFFGSYHQRAIIEERSCKPIDSTLKALRIKRTPGFGRANAELLKHQALLAKMTSDSPRPISGNDDSEDEMEDQEKTPPRKVTTSPGGAEDSITETATPRTIKRPHHADDEGYAPVVVPTRNPRRSVREDDESYEESESPPRKMRKLNRDENIVSSSNLVSHKAASTPEDTNLVTSSEDMPGQPRVVSTADVASQTHKKLLHGKQCQKAVQVELQPAVVSCTCEDKYNAMLTTKTESLQAEHKEDKEKALKELEDRLRADFEDDKQQAVARAMSNIQRESERVQRQTETRCKEQYMEEMKKLAQKHKTEISTTKKKQWCYNCEEEAMYHCCWNTSYCSVKCQQEHWHKEHKRMCRRKRT